MKQITFKSLWASLCLASPLFFAQSAQAAGKLTVYCTVQNNVCEAMTKKFAQQYNVETQFIHGGTGTILGRIKAEKDNPQADIWYGGTIEPHFQAGQLGLLEAYRSPKQAEILPQFKALMESEKGQFTSIVYMLVLGFGVNSEKLQKLGIDAPKKWADLLDPRLKGEVQLPDPRSSGTTYTIMATLIQLWGEDKAFEYLKQLDKNVSQYVKSTLVTANLSRGESTATVGFVHGYATEKEKGAPVEAVLPQDGVGYALGGVSLIKGGRNLDNAKLFMDWVLSKEAQEIPWREYGVYQIPTNVNAEVAPQSVKLDGVKLVELDYDRFSSSQEGKRLVDKWLSEVKLAK
ncbi:ABC transporter substrate-binding protein [Muribacter muris]|uniref:ABC transporter substrate-binding protein n=1 Tax=Muribacter muris TaxID=67855 RepID=A0A4Y9JT92_9PAST|nr:ABC transporter substrate-binding protein [Muribacter muris]MBF0785843.1 ABC transporter substrate-binding protein [Muribacter muris]MBF0827100.1 ABC transporter substrate-binding protein [Muribacter muris]TFV08542.1 ABC transporter substrate-binding protein [Muribacter muris]